MARRSPGEGSIYQRADGRWVASLSLEGRRRTVYGATRKEAAGKLAALKRQAGAGTLPTPGRRTVADLVAAWLEAVSPRLKPRTVHDYRQEMELHVLPALGRVRLSQVSPDRIQSLYATVQRRGHHRLAQRLHCRLHRMFRLAVVWGWMADNPCDKVLRPQYQAPRREVWTREELAAFLAGTDSHWLAPLWTLLLTSGCRLGEMLALTWDDVQGNSISISKAGQYIRGEWVVTPPKTRAGTRTISLPPEGTAALRRQKVQQLQRRLRAGPTWTDSRLVFTGEAGQPLQGSTVARALRRECRRLALPEVTPHGLRHLHASLLLREGLPLPEVSRRLGHAHSGITASIYSHAIGQDDSAATRAIERALSGSR